MEPEPVLLADGGDSLEGVVGAHDGGSGRGVDVERRLSRRLCSQDAVAERRGYHPALTIDGDRPDVRGADTARQGALLHRIMSVYAGEEDELVRAIAFNLGLRIESTAGNY